ncbi:MAG: O-antigen ligase family protein [Dysgonomonas sp.]|nr:O-antigen ligase family protein [Dysgonomonas sp.]
MKEYKLFAFIIAFTIILRASFLVVESSYIYYAILFIGAIFIISRKLFTFTWEINLKSLVFLFICLLSIVLNDIDPFFSPWERFIGFCLLLIIVGPFDDSTYSANLKKEIMFYLQNMIIIFVLISFFIFILKIPIGFVRGSFNGLSSHSMTMSPMAVLAFLFCLDRFMMKGITEKKYKKYIYLILGLICLFVASLATSRGAMGGMLFAIVVYICFKYHKRNHVMFGYILAFATLFTAIIVLNPGGMLDALYNKIENSSSNITSGRDKMWQDRIADFESSPIIGVGFLTMKEVKNSKIDFFEGTQESGSGWLMLLSSTGILGFISYLLLIIPPLIQIWRYFPNYGLSVAVCAFFATHTIIEGYTLAFGSPLCALMWLNIGVLNTVYKLNKK